MQVGDVGVGFRHPSELTRPNLINKKWDEQFLGVLKLLRNCHY